ncbi:hypothetical protein [Corynebacterium uterequi]|uniref:Uncharacterized protein n=1 Tax=Corynebacterium uterequi TaxID=1072256 RepID=A0A0G3HFT5_9CORY|nr:hypothetical protein [Corynebacterium uterequi]AKK10818.1 hypothetical protein CUTER_04060 [Corynebacterium uterequi]
MAWRVRRHPASRSVVRDSFSRSEAVAALAWLAGFAAVAAVIEAFYLSASVRIMGADIALPWPLVAAPWFNAVLVKTAKLWSQRTVVALVPIVVWAAALGVAWQPAAALLTTWWPLAVLAALGVLGGLRPLVRGR